MSALLHRAACCCYCCDPSDPPPWQYDEDVGGGVNPTLQGHWAAHLNPAYGETICNCFQPPIVYKLSVVITSTSVPDCNPTQANYSVQGCPPESRAKGIYAGRFWVMAGRFVGGCCDFDMGHYCEVFIRLNDQGVCEYRAYREDTPAWATAWSSTVPFSWNGIAGTYCTSYWTFDILGAA